MSNQNLVRSTSWAGLLKRARTGDESAIGQICECYRGYLTLMARAELDTRLRAKLSAADIVQESMFDAHRDFQSFRGESEAEFRSWLTRLFLNLVEQTRRFNGTRIRDITREVALALNSGEQPIPSTVKTPSSIVSRREQEDELRRAIECLPDRQRSAIELRYRDRLEYAEIANRLEISEDAARKAVSRAIKSLRSTVPAIPPDQS